MSDIESIKARLEIKFMSERCRYCRDFHKGEQCQAQGDVAFLLSEVERLSKKLNQEYSCQGCGRTAKLFYGQETPQPPTEPRKP